MSEGTDSSADTATRRSGWELFRRRIAPVIFLIVLGLLATRTCRSDTQRLTVEVDFDGDRTRVRAVSVEYFRAGEPDRVAHMRAELGPGGAPGPLRQELQLDRGTYVAAIVVTTDRGPVRAERRIVVEDQDLVRIRVDLDSP